MKPSRHPIILSFLLSLFFLSALPAHADFESGVKAYQAGDYAQALEEWRPLAAAGDKEAQLGLAVLYDKGQGLSQDFAQAAIWYEKAAQQGHPVAKHNLALLYQTGRGTAVDLDKARRLFQAAAAQGYDRSLVNLGFIYEQGLGVPIDLVQAHKWYDLAAVQGRFPQARVYRQRVAAQMTEEQIKQAVDEALEFQPQPWSVDAQQ
jgi:hypothetical protein